MNPVIRCENQLCPFNAEAGDSGLYPRKCGAPHDILISETGECSTYWWQVTIGKAKDYRGGGEKSNLSYLAPVFPKGRGGSMM
ncbi:hypothetical protein LCGC14_0607540 [marine sediment metagenome]|uniref:Uncharacterized protein n=1 Tax=marine sediment metagenome TaxID=412755 RepID=A0A0F9UH84_9ZZZZ